MAPTARTVAAHGPVTPITRRGTTVGGAAEAVGSLAPPSAPRPYTGLPSDRPISKPAMDPFAPVSQPGIDPFAARPAALTPRAATDQQYGRPLGQPSYDPMGPSRPPTAGPATRPYDPGAAVAPHSAAAPVARPPSDPPQSLDTLGVPPRTQPYHEPAAPAYRPASQAAQRTVVVGGNRMAVGGPQFRSESAAPSQPISKPNMDPYAARPIGQPISRPAADPYAARPLLPPTAPRPISQPTHDPYAALRGAVPPPSIPGQHGAVPPPSIPGQHGAVPAPSIPGQHGAVPPPKPISQPGADPYAALRAPSQALGKPISQPGADPFAALRPPTQQPISRPAYDPYAPPKPVPPPQLPAHAQPAEPSSAAARNTGTRTPVAADPQDPTVLPNHEDLLQTLAEMALQPPPTSAEIAELAASLRRRRYMAGEAMIKQGQPAETACIFVVGVAHMEYATPGRPVVTFGALRPGDIAGDGAVAGGGFHGCSVVADSPCVVLTLTSAKAAEIRLKQPELAEKLRRAVLAQQARK